MFWILTPCQSIIFKYFLQFHRFSFCFVCGFLCFAKYLSIRSHLFIFVFISLDPEKYCCDLCPRALPVCFYRSFQFQVLHLICFGL